MNRTEISKLESAGRAAMAWIPEEDGGRTHYRSLLAEVALVAGIVAVAITLLLAVF